jgi:muconate cycloisomerase
MRSFEHAAASRDVARTIVVRLELSDGRVGWGETLPRDYVTGETFESAIVDIRDRVWPAVREQDLSDPGAVDVSAADIDGRCMNAAACAVELAIWWTQAPPANRRKITARVSGVLGSVDPSKTACRLRLMHLIGLRDFKLKLGFGDEIDTENLRICQRKLGKGIRRGKASLRVDVNGGWDAETTPQRIKEIEPYGVCVVEQPTFIPAEELFDLAGRCTLPLMADESLITEEQARLYLADPKRMWWNVRISKNGGLERTRRLLALAAENGVTVSNGCMVGESGILSAVQRRLLETSPQPRFVEGNYGRLLLREDLTRPSIRFGYGGRLKSLRGDGFGVKIDIDNLQRYSTLVENLK